MGTELIADAALIALIITFIVQLYYLILEMTGAGFGKIIQKGNYKPPVSVIICARNEMKNLRINLPSILDQEYPQYQVVVVNDCSWDESQKFLDEMGDAFPNLKVVSLKEQERYPHGKKLALTLGIKGATYDHLVFTDADCRPASRNWLAEMASGFSEGKEIVIGYGAYSPENGILNKWIRFDTFYNALFYLGRALKGKAFMGVGRNMGYTRQLFFKNKGFASHYHIMSGDDDLFINETAGDANTSVILNEQAFTYSKPKSSWAEWFHQKKRHMSTGSFYKMRDKIFISTYFISLGFFWVSVVMLMLLKHYQQAAVIMLTTRLIIQLIVFWKGMKKLKETDLIGWVPFFELFLLLLYPMLTASNLVIKTKTWK